MTWQRRGVHVLVFTNRTGDAWAHAETLARATDGCAVNRLTAKYKELELVVEHGVVEPFVVVVLVHGAVAARIPREVSVEELLRDLHALV